MLQVVEYVKGCAVKARSGSLYDALNIRGYVQGALQRFMTADTRASLPGVSAIVWCPVLIDDIMPVSKLTHDGWCSCCRARQPGNKRQQAAGMRVLQRRPMHVRALRASTVNCQPAARTSLTFPVSQNPLTHWPPWPLKNVRIKEFRSPRELETAILASACVVPFPPVKIDGLGYCIECAGHPRNPDGRPDRSELPLWNLGNKASWSLLLDRHDLIRNLRLLLAKERHARCLVGGAHA